MDKLILGITVTVIIIIVIVIIILKKKKPTIPTAVPVQPASSEPLTIVSAYYGYNGNVSAIPGNVAAYLTAHNVQLTRNVTSTVQGMVNNNSLYIPTGTDRDTLFGGKTSGDLPMTLGLDYKIGNDSYGHIYSDSDEIALNVKTDSSGNPIPASSKTN